MEFKWQTILQHGRCMLWANGLPLLALSTGRMRGRVTQSHCTDLRLPGLCTWLAQKQLMNQKHGQQQTAAVVKKGDESEHCHPGPKPV